MPKKELQIAAQHNAPEIGKMSGTLRVAGTAGDAAVTHGGSGGGSIPRTPVHHKAHRATLIKASKVFAAQSATLGDAPEKFDKDKHYRVQLTQTVVGPAGNALRPADDVMVSGEYAETISEFISGATEV